jgi:hypothetical protein
MGANLQDDENFQEAIKSLHLSQLFNDQKVDIN